MAKVNIVTAINMALDQEMARNGSIVIIGEDVGRGFTVNLPVPLGLGDGDYRRAYREILAAEQLGAERERDGTARGETGVGQRARRVSPRLDARMARQVPTVLIANQDRPKTTSTPG